LHSARALVERGRVGADLRRSGALILLLGLGGLALSPARCGAAGGAGATVHVKILGLNDFHGQITARTMPVTAARGRPAALRPVGGAPVLAAYLEAELARLGPDRTVIAHAGDLVGASVAPSALLEDEPSIMFFNLLEGHARVVATLGNHEFDHGKAELLRQIRGGNARRGPFLEDPWLGATYPYVCANVVDEGTGELLLPPYRIERLGGVPVAFVGVCLRGTPAVTVPAGVAGVRFLDEAEAVNAWIPEIQRVTRAIVVLIHQGGAQDCDFAAPERALSCLTGPINEFLERLDDGVDVVISGHTHSFTNQVYTKASGKQVLVTQAFWRGAAYADIDLEIDPATREVAAKRATIHATFGDVGPGLLPDLEAAALVEAAAARVARLVGRVVGNASAPLSDAKTADGEEALGDLIADAQRAATGADFALVNPGGIRTDLAAGPVTWGGLFAVQPFGNNLVTMELTGAQLVEALEQQWASGANAAAPQFLRISGFTYSWKRSNRPGHRVTGVRKADGTPLDRAATYTVAANAFLAEGGDNFTVLAQGTNRVVGPLDLDALVAHVESLPQPFGPPPSGRVTVEP
jgi:5'-nucleotidase